MISVKKEALRYLGYRGNEPDEATAGLIEKGHKALCDTVSPHYCHKIIMKEDAGSLLKGNDIAKHLEKSDRAVFFAATLGSGADKLIRTAEITNMAYALVLDALSSAMIEDFCDNAENELKAVCGGHFTWRYSPGYGDYPIELQPDIIRFLNADKLIGLTVTESNILIPRKSVTAVIGISEHEQDSKSRSCATCNMRETCKFRREGNSCHD